MFGLEESFSGWLNLCSIAKRLSSSPPAPLSSENLIVLPTGQLIPPEWARGERERGRGRGGGRKRESRTLQFLLWSDLINHKPSFPLIGTKLLKPVHTQKYFSYFWMKVPQFCKHIFNHYTRQKALPLQRSYSTWVWWKIKKWTL